MTGTQGVAGAKRQPHSLDLVPIVAASEVTKEGAFGTMNWRQHLYTRRMFLIARCLLLYGWLILLPIGFVTSMLWWSWSSGQPLALVIRQRCLSHTVVSLLMYAVLYGLLVLLIWAHRSQWRDAEDQERQS